MFLNKFLDSRNTFYLNDRYEILNFGNQYRKKNAKDDIRKKLYDKRILSLLEEDDLTIFAEEIDPFVWDYYRSLGLATIRKENIFYTSNYSDYPSLTKAILANRLLMRKIKQKNLGMLIPYIESHHTQLLAQKLGAKILRSSFITDWMNNKINYRKVIQQLNLPAIPSYIGNNLKEAKQCFRVLRRQGFKEIILKKEKSAAGFGVFIVKTEKELESQLKKNFPNQPLFLLEGFVEKIKISPNVQYWIGPNKIYFIVVSDQILTEDRVSHIGNIFPSELIRLPSIFKKIKDFSLRICNYLQSRRCYGLVGIDFLITGDGQIYSPEINVRLNASTFPALIVKQLFHESDKIFWRSFDIDTNSFCFQKLFSRSPNQFISQRKKFGIFPIDFDYCGGQFMAIGSSYRTVNNYIGKFLNLLKQSN